MGVIHLFRRLVFVQVLVGILAACMAERNPGLLLVAGTLAALSWYVVEGPTGRPLSRWLTLPAALGATLNFAYEFYQSGGQDLVFAIAHFTMWLQIILLYGNKTNREYAQILALSLMHMISASVMTVSMIFGVFLAVYCVLALFTVLLFQLKISSDLVLQNNQSAAPPGEPVQRPKAVVGRGYQWQFRVTAVSTGVLCALIAAIVFLFVPRTEQLKFPMGARSAWAPQSTGFRPRVSLRDPPTGSGSREIVLNMQLTHSRHQIDFEEESWLLRGAVMDRYDPSSCNWTSRLTGMISNGVTIDLQVDGAALQAVPDDSTFLDAHITLLNPATRYLFTLHPVSYVNCQNKGSVTFTPHDHQLRTLSGTTGPVVYHLQRPGRLPRSPYPLLLFSLGLAPSQEVDDGVVPEEIREAFERHDVLLAHNASISVDQSGRRWRIRDTNRTYIIRRQEKRLHVYGSLKSANTPMNWPIQSRRVRRLTEQVLADAGLKRNGGMRHDPDAWKICKAIESFLSDPEYFEYTLDFPPAIAPEDPVIQFLFTHRKGHCELFASALAAMGRSIGMATRVVTGYRASEYNRIGGYYVVRRSNAHAWAEVEVGPSDWRSFDPSPVAAVRREHEVPRGWFTRLRELYEYLEFAWVRTVVAYNRVARKDMLIKVNESLQNVATSDKSWAAAVWRWVKKMYHALHLDELTMAIASVIVFFILVGTVSFLRTLIVRRRRLVALQLTSLSRQQRRVLARHLHFYLSMLDLLERRGYIRPTWQSPFRFAQELAEKQPAIFEPVVALTEHFYEIRFGYRQLDDRRKQSIRKYLRRLEQTLKQRGPA